MEELNPTARIVWKLARNHTWGQPMPEEDLIAITATDEDNDEMRAHLEAALKLPFLSSGPHGIYIPNGQAKHEETANWLRENTELQEYKIKATLSRLPPEWPTS
jgi:hypothetical protein